MRLCLSLVKLLSLRRETVKDSENGWHLVDFGEVRGTFTLEFLLKVEIHVR